jgi:hypothetical protein
MLLSIFTLLHATILDSTSARSQHRRASRDGTPTRPESATVGPYQPCGLIRAGSPPVPTLTQCLPGSECTPKEVSCNTSNCTHICVPMASCNDTNPCPAHFTCLPHGLDSSEGLCDRKWEKPTSEQNATVGARCGVLLPLCADGQDCIGTDPMCYSEDVCYGVCKKIPIRPPPKYPACGGYTRKPNTCLAPNICINDPFSGGCGMACDMPGICVK